MPQWLRMLKKAAVLRKAEAEVKAERGSGALYLNLSLNLNLLPAGGLAKVKVERRSDSLYLNLNLNLNLLRAGGLFQHPARAGEQSTISHWASCVRTHWRGFTPEKPMAT